MKKLIFFLTSALFLTACASSFYSSEKKEKNNSFALKSNVSNLTIQFPNAKPKDTEFYDQELTINSGNTFTYPYLRKRLLTVLVSSGDESKTIKIKRKVRGGALFKSISLGLFTYAIPLLVDPFNPDFYKISKESKEVFVSFKNSAPNPTKTNNNVAVDNIRTNSTVSVSTVNSSSIAKPVEAENNSVTLTVSAQGKTKEEAKYNAFRDALERAFGAFISSNTQILNDEIIKDEIISVSNGNIQKFDVKSEIQLPDGTFTNVVEVTVSINKLISFCESKGVSVEFQGGLFAANLKLQELNKKNEESVMKNMHTVISSIAKIGYDFTVNTGQPVESRKYLDAYDVSISVDSKFNNNMIQAIDILKQTVKSIILSESEAETLKKQRTKIYPISLGNVKGYLRSINSVLYINHFIIDVMPYFSKSFAISNGIETLDYTDIEIGKNNLWGPSDESAYNRHGAEVEIKPYRDITNIIKENVYFYYEVYYRNQPTDDNTLLNMNLLYSGWPMIFKDSGAHYEMINTLSKDQIAKIREYKVQKK